MVNVTTVAFNEHVRLAFLGGRNSDGAIRPPPPVCEAMHVAGTICDAVVAAALSVGESGSATETTTLSVTERGAGNATLASFCS